MPYRIAQMLLMSAMILSCDPSPAPNASKGKMDGKSQRGQGRRSGGNIAVRTQKLQAQSLPRTIALVSILEGRKQAQVYSRVAGRLSFIGPAEGVKVTAGETLFRVDRSDPGESFLATPVVSPISGWVGRWLVTSLGAQVTAQEPIVTVVDDDVLRGRVQLPTAEWLKVSDVTPVRVTVAGSVRSGKVFGITRAADSSTSRGTVSVEIENADHQWKAGMVATVSFDLETKLRLILPASSLSITDQGSFTFVVTDGKAKRMPVTFYVIDNDRVEILGGLEEGQEVITQGVNQVGDGVAVNIVSPEQG